MTAIDGFGEVAQRALATDPRPIADARSHVPPVPGLYAIHAPAGAWSELGLEFRSGIPLYVGMSKSSLVARELGQHFAIDPAVAARTGGSTVRRSFAALLRVALDLHGVPRNPQKPERFANFGLESDADRRLTEWMHSRLTIAVWPLPETMPVTQLEAVETRVIRAWTPPLNIRRNPGRLRELQVARAVLAAEARSALGDARGTAAERA